MTRFLALVISFLDEATDIAIVTVAVFVLLRTLRGLRARLALVGVVLVGLVDLVAREVGLPLTAWFFQGLFLVSLVVLVLAFQDDLRRLFERLAAIVLRRRTAAPEEGILEDVVRASFSLAASRRGALIVLAGRDPMDSVLAGGFALDAVVSEPLLLSLFDPHSPGHDGAAIIESGRVSRFAAHLPLSSDFVQLGLRGTRHAAALGLSERSDALSVVVSEERGAVSMTRAGRLQPAEDPAALRRMLDAFLDEARKRRRDTGSPVWRFLTLAREWALAAALAVGLWVAMVPGSEITEMTVNVPVTVANLPAGSNLESVSPATVTVTVSGLRRRLFMVQPSDVVVTVDALLAQLGRRTFDLGSPSVRAPKGITVTAVQPEHVTISLRKPASSTAPRADAR